MNSKSVKNSNLCNEMAQPAKKLYCTKMIYVAETAAQKVS